MRNKYLIGIILSLILLNTLVFAQNITKQDAINAISQAEYEIQDMANSGFPIQSVNDTLVEAKLALERANFAESIRENPHSPLAIEARKALEGLDYTGFTYEGVLDYTKEISLKKKQSYELSDSIDAFDIKLKTYEKNDTNESLAGNIIAGFAILIGQKEVKEMIDTSEAEELIEKARVASEEERYKEADELLLQAKEKLEEKRTETTKLNILKKSGKSFIEKNWFGLVIFSIFITASSLFTVKKIKTKRTKGKLKKLKSEKKILVKLIKKNQEDRFKRGNISGLIYNIKMDKYHQRLNEVKQKIPVVEDMLKK